MFAQHADRTRADERFVLAGDDLLPSAGFQVTHHVDIAAPPAEVWPWLVQMGRRRGGWYSWDLLDNGGEPSADRIIPALQSLTVGDILPLKAKGPDGMAVLALDPPRALVLGDPSLMPGRPAPAAGTPRATWAFSLEPIGDAATHLLVRVRAEFGRSLKAALLSRLVGGLHEVMERKQLRTLKQRAESPGASPGGLKRLVGSGDKIGLLLLPFLIVGLLLNVLFPSLFSVGGPPLGLKVAAILLLIPGITIWIWSVVLILRKVPRNELITRGPYALVKHPLYTGVALLVLPSIGVLLNSWLGALLGVVLYVGSRMFSPEEERAMSRTFGAAWDAYCKAVKIPWL